MRLATLVRSNVDRQLPPNGRSHERGAVASIVAILFGTGVLLGLGALVIDTGSLLYERRQLQNGADAAALSLARNCAKAQAGEAGYSCDTSTGTLNSLIDLAGKNAADQKSDIASVCGSAALVAANPSAFPTACVTLLSPGLVDCPITTSTVKFVEVRSSTRTAAGTILPPILAQMLAGGTYSGETVKACARAGWGPLAYSGPALPLVIGVCEWNQATAQGTLFAPPPTLPSVQYTPAPNRTVYKPNGNQAYNLPSLPTVVPSNTIVSIIAHTTSGSNAVNNCPATPAPPAGQDYPGGFGWTTADTSCSAIFTDTGNLTGDGGGAPPFTCKHDGPVASFVGKIVNIPIFTNVTIANGTATYTISGLAAFYLAGYANISTVSDMFGYAPPASLQCKSDANASTCIWGWFTDPVATGEIIGAGAPRGPIVVQVLG